MSHKRRRVENLKKSFEPLGALSTRYKGSKAGHGTHPQRPGGSQVVVQAELEVRIPARGKAPAAAFDPLGYELPVAVRAPTTPAMSSSASLAATRIALDRTSFTKNGWER